MKSQHGLIVCCGIPLLVGALQMSGGALADDASSRENVVTDDQYVSIRTVASMAAAPMPSASSTAEHQSYVGTLYRNGGHYGEEKSDVKLEKDSR